MKYLENLTLEKLTNSISNRVLAGGRVIDGRIEAYSTKRAGEDKKQSKILEQKLCSSISPTEPSPKSNIKLLIDLIQTLNASLVDYDFSSLTPESFETINTNMAVHQINASLAELTIAEPIFLTEMWTHIDAVITLSQCETFCLKEDPFAGDEENRVMWSFVYFFFNRELKRICLMTCISSSIHRRNSVFGDPNSDDMDDTNDGEEEAAARAGDDYSDEDDVESFSQEA